ncbi:hypothetical protein ACFE04_027841 [Oxalis oulophora]
MAGQWQVWQRKGSWARTCTAGQRYGRFDWAGRRLGRGMAGMAEERQLGKDVHDWARDVQGWARDQHFEYEGRRMRESDGEGFEGIRRDSDGERERGLKEEEERLMMASLRKKKEEIGAPLLLVFLSIPDLITCFHHATLQEIATPVDRLFYEAFSCYSTCLSCVYSKYAMLMSRIQPIYLC